MAASYIIVYGESPEELVDNVSDQVDNGFSPVGGVAIDTRKLDPLFYQGMYKSE